MKVLEPRAAAELAVGDDLKTDVLLQAHDVADRLVLDLFELGIVQRTAGAAVLIALCSRPRVEADRPWTQQAADVLLARNGGPGSRGGIIISATAAHSRESRRDCLEGVFLGLFQLPLSNRRDAGDDVFVQDPHLALVVGKQLAHLVAQHPPRLFVTGTNLRAKLGSEHRKFATEILAKLHNLQLYGPHPLR